MTEGGVLVAAERPARSHGRFAPLFGEQQARDHAYTYAEGLMACPERKAIEPIASNVGDGQVSALQKSINIAPRDHGDAQIEIQSVFADKLAPTAAGSPIGVVGVVDESGFAKKGDHGARAGRRYNGRLGKRDDCQVGVFFVGVTPGGSAPLGHQIYPPEGWCEPTEECPGRRERAHIPEGETSGTKPRVAAGSIRRVMALGIVTLDWITAAEAYGQDGGSLDEVGGLGLAVCGRSAGRHDRLGRGPGRVRAALWRAGSHADEAGPGAGLVGGRGRLVAGAGVVSGVGSGSGSERAAGLRVRLDPRLGGAPRRGRAADPVADAAVVGAGARGGCQELPGYGGIRDAIVGRLAPPHEPGGDGAPVRHPDAARVGERTADLTLDRTARLLRRAMEIPGLSLEMAILLVEYHIRRNEIARESHTKAWLAGHKDVELLSL